MEKLYTVKDAAKELAVSRTTIYKWKKKKLIEIINMNGIPKIRESEIKRLRGEK